MNKKNKARLSRVLDVLTLIFIPYAIVVSEIVWVKVLLAFLYGVLVTLICVNFALDKLNAILQEDIEDYKKLTEDRNFGV